MNNNRRTLPRPLRRRLVRLPEDPRLRPCRLIPRYQTRADGEEGAHVRHVGVVPHEQAVLVGFAESGRGEPGVDAYGAVVWE